MNIPVEDAQALGEKYGLQQVLIFAFDGKTAFCTTWGVDAAASATAAAGGNQMKRTWGWPENTIVESAKVQKLYNRIAELESIIDTEFEPGRRW